MPPRPYGSSGVAVFSESPLSRLGSQLSLRSKSSNLASRTAPFVFGIDFGTTYTGVAWAARSGKVRPEDIHLVRNWDSVQYLNAEREKTPTAISYTATKHVSTWGYNIPGGTESIQWFKLLLLDDEDLQEHLKSAPQLANAKKRIKAMGLTPTQVIADYLRNLWSHALADVEKAMTTNFVRSTPFRIVVTVPAIWKSYTRERMREAVNMAGLLVSRDCGPTELDFVSEPEAAAIATFTTIKGRHDIKVGTTITVVDAGGGTVDLISYQIVDTKRFAAKEAVEGTGALCGAIFLDQEFEMLVREHIDPKIWEQVPAEEIQEMMNQSWEHGIKQQFTLNHGSERLWKVRLPARVVELTGKPDITIPSSTIAEIFDHVVSKILDLVDDQVERLQEKTGSPPDFVILVGGFGKCKYLYERLTGWLGDICPVMQPSEPGPWTAICRGAVIRGSEDAAIHITSRISRSNYGHPYNTPFQEGVHDERDKRVDPITLGTYAFSQLEWFVKKGENTVEKTPQHLEYHRVYFKDQPDEYPDISTLLVTYDGDQPPGRHEPEVKDLCTINFRSPIPFHELPCSRNANDQEYRYFVFSFLISIDGASLNLVVQVNGQQIGSKNLSINFEKAIRTPEHPKNSPRSVSAPEIPIAPQRKPVITSDDPLQTPSFQRHTSRASDGMTIEPLKRKERTYIKQIEVLSISPSATTGPSRSPVTSGPQKALRPSSSRWSLPKSPSMLNLSQTGPESTGLRDDVLKAWAPQESSPGGGLERRPLRREHRRVEDDLIELS
ncbi:hypothetical protein QBC40DRAFT_282891, partial [Triangularia verruculosa]